MATSKVQIWNLALNHIGQRPISSDTDTSVMATTCARSWDAMRREVLRECDWGFATVIESLAEIANYTPPQGWGFAYSKPPKALAVRKIFSPVAESSVSFQFPSNATSELNENSYSVPIRTAAGEKFREIYRAGTNTVIILSNTESAVSECTWDVEDTTLYDATCVTLLGFRLASDIATALTGDGSIALNLMKVYNARLGEAQRLNATTNNTRALGNSSLLDAR